LIGAGSAVLIVANGRIAGISGILDRLLHGASGPGGWRIGFLAGLVIPGLILGSGNPVFGSGPWTLDPGRRRAAGGIWNTYRQGLHQRPWGLWHGQPLAALCGRHADFHWRRDGDRVWREASGSSMSFLSALIAGLLFGAGLLLGHDQSR